MMMRQPTQETCELKLVFIIIKQNMVTMKNTLLHELILPNKEKKNLLKPVS